MDYMDDYCFNNGRQPVFRVIKRGDIIEMSSGYYDCTLYDGPYEYFLDLFNDVSSVIGYNYSGHTKDAEKIMNAKLCIICDFIVKELNGHPEFDCYYYSYDTLRHLGYINLYGRERVRTNLGIYITVSLWR